MSTDVVAVFDLFVETLTPLLTPGTIYNLVRTSHALHRLLRPFLYRTVTIHPGDRTFLTTHPATHPDLAHIRRLHLPSDAYTVFLPLLAHLARLRTLHVTLAGPLAAPLAAPELPAACALEVTAAETVLQPIAAGALRALLAHPALAALAYTPPAERLRHAGVFLIPFAFIGTGTRVALPPAPLRRLRALSYPPADLAADLRAHPALARTLRALTLQAPTLDVVAMRALFSLRALQSLVIRDPHPTAAAAENVPVPAFHGLRSLVLTDWYAPRHLATVEGAIPPMFLPAILACTSLVSLSTITLSPAAEALLPDTLESLEVVFAGCIPVLSRLPKLQVLRLSGVGLILDVEGMRKLAQSCPALCEFRAVDFDAEPNLPRTDQDEWERGLKRGACKNEESWKELERWLSVVVVSRYLIEIRCVMKHEALEELRRV